MMINKLVMMPTRVENVFLFSTEKEFSESKCFSFLITIFQFCFMSKGMILNIFGMKIGGVSFSEKDPFKP